MEMTIKPVATLDMEELAARQRGIQARSGVLFARNEDGEGKTAARQLILDLFTIERWPRYLRMLTMPGIQWRFERKLLGMREQGWTRVEHPARTHFMGVESDRAIFHAAMTQMPGLHNNRAELKRVRPVPCAELGVKTRYASLWLADVDDVLAYSGWGRQDPNKHGWDAVWLDYTGPLTVERMRLIGDFYRLYVGSTLIVTALKSRFHERTVRAIERAGGHSQWVLSHLEGDVLHDIEYSDTSLMAQIAVRRPTPLWHWA